MAKNGSADTSALSRLKHALARPGELVDSAQDAMQSVTDVGGTVSDVSDAVGGESSTFGKVRAALGAMRGGGKGEAGSEQKQRLIIQEAVDIAAPRQFVYDQWKDPDALETMSRAVRQVEGDDEGDGDDEDDGDDDGQDEDEAGEKTQWQAKILVSSRTWSAQLTDEIPGRRISWKSSGDVDHAGTVSFHTLDDMLTRVQLEMEYHPSGFVEKFGNLFLTVRHRTRKDLRLFKHYIELRAWPDSDEAQELEDTEEEATEEASAEEPSSDEESSSAEDDTAERAPAKKAPAKKAPAKKATAKKASSSSSSSRGSSKKSTGRKRGTKRSSRKKATARAS